MKISAIKSMRPVTKLQVMLGHKAGLEARLSYLKSCPANTDETYSRSDKRWVKVYIDEAEHELQKLNNDIEFLKYNEDWSTDHDFGG